MIKNQQKGWRLLIFCALLLSACVEQAPVSREPDWQGVDVLFREFWLDLSEITPIGPAALPAFEKDGRTLQYFETVLMVFDERLPRGKRFYLAPVGVQMGIYEPPVPPPTSPDLLYLNGHIVAPKMQKVYEAFRLYAGLPLSELRYNPKHRRYEQYFENLGMYYLEGSDEVHLLSYGLWACGSPCGAPKNPDGVVDIIQPIDVAYEPVVQQAGTDLTGFALSCPFLGRDNQWEQVLENVVLQIDPSLDPQTIRLRPLAQDLGIEKEPPRPYSGNPNMHFYSTDGSVGYEIPQFFWDYLAKHGGLALSGAPRNHFNLYDRDTYRQCFENFCLIYDPQMPESARVRPEPLGFAYLKNFAPAAAQERPVVAQSGFEVRIREQAMSLLPTQSQRIGIYILDKGQPVANWEADLTVYLPGGMRQQYRFPPTDANGYTQVDLPPIAVPSGTLIPYEVCLTDANLHRVCYPETFLIWIPPES